MGFIHYLVQRGSLCNEFIYLSMHCRLNNDNAVIREFQEIAATLKTGRPATSIGASLHLTILAPSIQLPFLTNL
jgi:hypothetical protein